MNTYDWNTKFTTEFIDQFGTKIMFNPLHKKDAGSMLTTYKDGSTIGGEYTLRCDGNICFMGQRDIEYLIRPTEKGFDLIVGESVKYSFTRIK